MLPPLVIQKWLGLNASLTFAELEPGECPVFSNVRLWDAGRKVVQRKGQSQVASGWLPDADLTGLFWHRLGGTDYLLSVTASGDVVNVNTGQTVTNGAGRFKGGSDVNACWLDAKILMGDGVNPNCVAALSGTTLVVTQLTVDPASGAATTLTAGSAGNPTGTYTYALKFLSALGVEGDIQSYSPAITVTSKQILLTNLITPPAGQDCSGKNLYRTTGAGGLHYFVTTLAASATTYTDNLADSSLGAGMLNEAYPNSPLPPCRYFLAQANRLYAAGCFQTTGSVTGSVNVLYVSDVLDPTTARLATDYTTTYQGGRFPLESPAQGTITGLGSYGNMVVAFTGGSMFLFTGTQPANFSLNPFSTHGCVSHRTILTAQEALIWLAPDGVYAWKAQGYLEYTLTQRSYVRISDKVRDRIDAMAASGMAQASAVFSDNRYYLSWPQGNLVYDLLYDAWYEDTGANWRQLAVSLFTPSNRQRLYGSLLGHSQVYQLDTGTLDGTGAIACHVQTSDLDAGAVAQNKRVAWAGGLFRSSTEVLSGSLIRSAGANSYTWVLSLTSGSVWQTLAASPNVVRMRERVPQDALSEHFRLDFACASRGGAFEILQGTLEFLDQGGGNISAGGVNG